MCFGHHVSVKVEWGLLKCKSANNSQLGSHRGWPCNWQMKAQEEPARHLNFKFQWETFSWSGTSSVGAKAICCGIKWTVCPSSNVKACPCIWNGFKGNILLLAATEMQICFGHLVVICNEYLTGPCKSIRPILLQVCGLQWNDFEIELHA